MRHNHHHAGHDHVLPAVESALASLALAAGPMTPPCSCGPTTARNANCATVASATVADPRTTQQVLDFVRWLVHPTDRPSPVLPTLVTITADPDHPEAVTVSFLRN